MNKIISDYLIQIMIVVTFPYRLQFSGIKSKAYQSIDEQITKTKEEKIEKLFDMMTRIM